MVNFKHESIDSIADGLRTVIFWGVKYIKYQIITTLKWIHLGGIFNKTEKESSNSSKNAVDIQGEIVIINILLN